VAARLPLGQQISSLGGGLGAIQAGHRLKRQGHALQVGKTTLVQQALAMLTGEPGAALAQHSVSADSPGLTGAAWLATQWEAARTLAVQAGECILVLDEVQKLPG